MPTSLPRTLQAFACDLSDTPNLEKNLTAMFEKATDGGKNLVNHIAFTAGDVRGLPKVAEMNVDQIMDVLRVRFFGASIIGKILASGKYMPSSTDSSFTMTSGTNTERPLPGWAFAAAGGAATEGLTRGLAVDLKPIRVNCVIPGAIHTEMLQGMLDVSTPEVVEKLKTGFCLAGEFGRPEDIAEAYGYIMRDRFATGRNVTSDGGRMLIPTEA